MLLTHCANGLVRPFDLKELNMNFVAPPLISVERVRPFDLKENFVAPPLISVERTEIEGFSARQTSYMEEPRPSLCSRVATLAFESIAWIVHGMSNLLCPP